MRELWLSREAVGKLRVTLAGLSTYKLWAEGSRDVYPVQLFLFLQDLFSSGLRLLRAGLVLLFSLEGRGISAYPTLPTPTLLNVNFLGSKETEAN